MKEAVFRFGVFWGSLKKGTIFEGSGRILRAGETFASHPKNNVQSTPFGKFTDFSPYLGFGISEKRGALVDAGHFFNGWGGEGLPVG